MKTRFHRFTTSLSLLSGLLGGIMTPHATAQYEGIDKHKLTVKSFIDFGHIVSGYNYYAPIDLNNRISWLPLNRANVLVIQDLAVGNFDVSVGLSGLYWWPYGQGKAADLTERVGQVKPMVPVARAHWQFGNPNETAGSIQIGTFNYKYNPDAKNLGEYLYRSGTYPGMLFTGEGWLLMNRAGNYSHGALFTLSQFGGKLKHNASLFMETVNYPVGDFSPGYDFSVTSKWFDFGGGAVFNHYLSLAPSQLTPKNEGNAYVIIHGKTAGGADTTVKGRLDQITPPETPSDTILTRWTLKGIKLMGRAALNLGPLLPENIRGPEDMRLFVEVALLGVKNYPLYYEKRIERMPVMFGITLPTAKLLDVLTLQGEVYKSRYSDASKFIQEAAPIWQTGQVTTERKDDLKWTIYGKKTVNKLINVYGQAASDHIRLTDGRYNPSGVPLTNSWKRDWYYLMRLEFNLR